MDIYHAVLILVSVCLFVLAVIQARMIRDRAVERYHQETEAFRKLSNTIRRWSP